MANTTNHSPEFEANKGRFAVVGSEAARNAGRKGAEAKAEKERRIKEWQENMKDKMVEYALMFLDANMLPGLVKVYEEFNLPTEDANNMMAIFMGMGRKAQQGDVTAGKFLLELAGIYTETKNLNITGNMPTTPKGDTLYEPNDEQNG